jgi:hypothetical protein
MSEEQVEMIADHIADFSLGSLRALQRNPVRVGKSAGGKKRSIRSKSKIR